MIKELNDRIKATRKALGYTQKQMGEAIGSYLSTWQDYEAGKSIPGGNALAGLARLGVDINWLLTGEGGKEPVKFFLGTTDAEDYLLSILPSLSQIIELHYSDNFSETRLSHLVRFKSGELQLVYSRMCYDRGARIEEVEKIRHGMALYSHQLLYADVSDEQLLSIEKNPSVKVMEDIFEQAKNIIESRSDAIKIYKRWLNFEEISSAQYEASEERCSFSPIEEFLFEKRKTGQDTGWVSLAFADCFSEFKEWLKKRQKTVE